MITNGDWLRAASEARNIPLRSLDDVRQTLEACAKKHSDKAMARLLANHGRLTDDARAFAVAWLER